MNIPTNDETLIAYLDAELDAAGMDAIEQALQADPTLRQRLQRLVLSGEQLRAAYAGVLEEAVPPRLVQAILEAPTPAAMSSPRARPRPAPAQPGWLSRWLGTGHGPWMPTALASVAALGLGLWLGLAQGPGGDATLAEHRPVADQALLVALESLPSGRMVRAAGREIELLASFRHRDGRVCREFNRSVLDGDPVDHLGLACREPGGDWTVAVLASEIRPAEAARSGYRTASDRQHAIIDGFRQQQALGQPLDLPDETAWMERGWAR
jgi:anti-sigma factor RsiW